MRRVVPLLAALAVLLVSGCQPAKPTWEDIAASPGATAYTGQLSEPLTTRLDGRLAERRQKVLGSRVEHLPAGVNWGQHLTWRNTHVGLMSAARETVPEPDAPVLYREYAEADRTLYVIGVADDTGQALIVLTALTAPADS